MGDSPSAPWFLLLFGAGAYFAGLFVYGLGVGLKHPGNSPQSIDREGSPISFSVAASLNLMLGALAMAIAACCYDPSLLFSISELTHSYELSNIQWILVGVVSLALVWLLGFLFAELFMWVREHRSAMRRHCRLRKLLGSGRGTNKDFLTQVRSRYPSRH